jgi:hypothetical protein
MSKITSEDKIASEQDYKTFGIIDPVIIAIIEDREIDGKLASDWVKKNSYKVKINNDDDISVSEYLAGIKDKLEFFQISGGLNEFQENLSKRIDAISLENSLNRAQELENIIEQNFGLVNNMLSNPKIKMSSAVSVFITGLSNELRENNYEEEAQVLPYIPENKELQQKYRENLDKKILKLEHNTQKIKFLKTLSDLFKSIKLKTFSEILNKKIEEHKNKELLEKKQLITNEINHIKTTVQNVQLISQMNSSTLPLITPINSQTSTQRNI